jgi:hypothetical protein
MKRYLVFGGKCYYPSGSSDIRSSWDSLEQAIEGADLYLTNEGMYSYAEVYDCQEMKRIWSFSVDDTGEKVVWS